MQEVTGGIIENGRLIPVKDALVIMEWDSNSMSVTVQCFRKGCPCMRRTRTWKFEGDFRDVKATEEGVYADEVEKIPCSCHGDKEAFTGEVVKVVKKMVGESGRIDSQYYY